MIFIITCILPLLLICITSGIIIKEIYKITFKSILDGLKKIIKYLFKDFYNSFVTISISCFVILFYVSLIVNDKSKNIITLISLIFFILFSIFIAFTIYKINKCFSDDFITDKKLNNIRILTLVVPLFYSICIYFMFQNMYILENKVYAMSFKIIIILLLFCQLIFNVILIGYGIKKCILNKQSIMPERKNLSLLETKVLIILTWFLIIFLNATAMVYITYKIDNNAFAHKGIFDSAYYALITMLTIGFGDITPKNNLGKLITCIISLLSAYLMIIGVAGILDDSNDKGKNSNYEKPSNPISEVTIDKVETFKDKEVIIKQINALYKLYKTGAITNREYKKKKKELLKKVN